MYAPSALSGRAVFPVQWVALAAAGVVSVAAGRVVTHSPRYALAAAVAALALALALVLPARVVVAVMIFYLPFESWLVGYLPGSAATVARYGVEAIGVALFAVALVSRRAERNRWGAIALPVAAVLVTWGLAALFAGVSPSTALIGFRAELRWLLVGLVVALTYDRALDTRWYGRAVVGAAALQSCIALSEWLGGSAVSAVFAPDYQIVIGGLAVSSSASAHVHSVLGTFGNHNALATYLVFAWVVLIAVGRQGLGIRRELFLVLALVLPFVIVVTGSREAALALVVAAAVVARVRFRLPTVRVALLVGVAVVAFGSVYTTTTTLDKDTRGQLAMRWAVIFNPDTYSPTGGGNFRLSLLFQEVGLVTRQSPLLGYGVGSVVDPRTVPDGTNPLYRIPAGVDAINFRYIFDGNWGLLIIETGFLGLAAVIVLLTAMWRIGVRGIDDPAGVVVYCLIPCVVVLGFFECVLQDASSNLVLWVFTGLAIATPRRGQAQPAAVAFAVAPPSPRVSLTSATAEQLQTLHGIGPALTQRIIDYRATHGGFRSIADLEQVSGIGPARLAALRDHVCL